MLPDWLNATPQPNIAHDPATGLPELDPNLPTNHPYNREVNAIHRKTIRQILHEQFDIAYDGILDTVMSGSTLSDALKEHPQCFDHGRFVRWINSDPERKRRYSEAKELRSEAWAGEIIRHSKATGMLEDVARSKLICDSYKWLMSADNRPVYGDVKQINTTSQISIVAALTDARARIAPLSTSGAVTLDHDPQAEAEALAASYDPPENDDDDE